ncbi:unnamed protein product [Cuscuta campestris]|uniref:Protein DETOXIFICATION n=1 Tax=Cuscuta campestris TaxID=132261 RepID=A0A484LG14_9ASTE|nr:unnamed protein product [Cuscuta campestris]
MGELIEVNRIALPMILVTVSQFLLRTSPILMLGHLGQLHLSAASIATSLSNVTGYSVLFGMSGALEMLCGQAYGAGQQRKLATFTYGAILGMFLVCIPVAILWLLTEKLLLSLGQDPSIAAEAGKYAIWLIPTLFPYSVLQSLVRYLLSQGLIVPMVWSAVASLCLQVPICWVFVFKMELGSAGAALSIGISYWANVVFILFYVAKSSSSSTCKIPSSCHAASFTRDAFLTMGDFFKLAVPSAVMVCLEWWSFELILLLSGLLPNPKLETSVLSICFTTTSVHCNIPYSFGAAASVRVSNAVGGRKAEAARVAVYAVMVLAATEVVVTSAVIFGCRGVWGRMFTSEDEVVGRVREMVPLICVSTILDGTQAVLSGVVRGSGWQRIGACVNLASFYLVGIPVSLLLGFGLDLKALGLWLGLVAGAFVQSASLLCTFISSLNRAPELIEARLEV